MSRIVAYPTDMKLSRLGSVIAYPQRDGAPSPLEDLVRGFFQGSTYLGSMYDFQRPESMFQAASGGEPVSTYGNPVGGVLDLRNNLARDPGNYSVPSNWSTVGPWVVDVAAGTAFVDNPPGAVSADLRMGPANQLPGWSSGYGWEVEFDYVAGGTHPSQQNFNVYAATGTPVSIPNGSGHFRMVTSFNAASTTLFRCRESNFLQLSNIVIRRIPGWHLYQATLGARPNFQPGGLYFDGLDDLLMGNVAIPPGMSTLAMSMNVTANASASVYTVLYLGSNSTRYLNSIRARGQPAAAYMQAGVRELDTLVPTAPFAQLPTNSTPPGMWHSVVATAGGGLVRVETPTVEAEATYENPLTNAATTLSLGLNTSASALERVCRRMFCINRTLTAYEKAILYAWLTGP